MRLICDTWVWCSIASAGAIPTRLNTMRELFTRLVLPARRPNRSYPRAVKNKMTNYARKACREREAVLNRMALRLAPYQPRTGTGTGEVIIVPSPSSPLLS